MDFSFLFKKEICFDKKWNATNMIKCANLLISTLKQDFVCKMSKNDIQYFLDPLASNLAACWMT